MKGLFRKGDMKEINIFFVSSVLNNDHITRSFILLISKWISLIERRIDQTEPCIKYLNPTKYLHLLSFNSQITNDINMPGELWHAPEANFYFRINKFFPTIERIFKYERYFNRLTIRAHNGKIMYYLLSNNYQIISLDKNNSQWDLEENTLQFLKMINNICIRKEKELLKRHMQIFLPHLCTYLPSLRLIEDNRLTVNLIEIYNDRLMLPIRKYYELIDDNNDQLINIYQLIQNEYFSNKQLLHQWTLNEYSNATGYFSFRKIFTISMSFYSTLNYIFGFNMYANNQLNIQRSIGNVNPLYLRLQDDLTKQDENIYLTPNIDTFINHFGKMGPLTATILATLTSLAQPKYQIIEYLKIFYKEDIHLKHPDLTQKECVGLVENLARQLETKLTQFIDFDVSKTIVSQLVQNSTDITQLARLNPLNYPWL
jgi:transformation/transcription domain-associated protein